MTGKAAGYEVDQSTLDYKSRWNNLRSMGNSPIARASIAVPILGYLIIFHSDLINYLRLHSDFCAECQVSWRLHFLYFGACAFAVGSIIYGLYCPTLIKQYGGATDFYESERGYFSNVYNYEYLRTLIRNDHRKHRYSPTVLSSLGDRGTALRASVVDEKDLGGTMGEYYVLQNMSYPSQRYVTGMSYLVGSILLFVPSAWTFVQVIIQALR